jgi:hypothetical protein
MKDIDELNDKINSLQQEIDKLSAATEFATKPEKVNISLFKPSLITLKSPIVYYFAIPLSVFILLFLLKPPFIMESVSENGNFPKKKLNYKKLLIATILFSIILAFVIFIFFYKKMSLYK